MTITRKNTCLALEPRFVFDGAATQDFADVLPEPLQPVILETDYKTVFYFYKDRTQPYKVSINYTEASYDIKYYHYDRYLKLNSGKEFSGFCNHDRKIMVIPKPGCTYDGLTFTYSDKYDGSSFTITKPLVFKDSLSPFQMSSALDEYNLSDTKILDTLPSKLVDRQYFNEEERFTLQLEHDIKHLNIIYDAEKIGVYAEDIYLKKLIPLNANSRFQVPFDHTCNFVIHYKTPFDTTNLTLFTKEVAQVFHLNMPIYYPEAKTTEAIIAAEKVEEIETEVVEEVETEVGEEVETPEITRLAQTTEQRQESNNSTNQPQVLIEVTNSTELITHNHTDPALSSTASALLHSSKNASDGLNVNALNASSSLRVSHQSGVLDTMEMPEVSAITSSPASPSVRSNPGNTELPHSLTLVRNEEDALKTSKFYQKILNQVQNEGVEVRDDRVLASNDKPLDAPPSLRASVSFAEASSFDSGLLRTSGARNDEVIAETSVIPTVSNTPDWWKTRDEGMREIKKEIVDFIKDIKPETIKKEQTIFIDKTPSQLLSALKDYTPQETISHDPIIQALIHDIRTLISHTHNGLFYVHIAEERHIEPTLFASKKIEKYTSHLTKNISINDIDSNFYFSQKDNNLIVIKHYYEWVLLRNNNLTPQYF